MYGTNLCVRPYAGIPANGTFDESVTVMVTERLQLLTQEESTFAVMSPGLSACAAMVANVNGCPAELIALTSSVCAPLSGPMVQKFCAVPFAPVSVAGANTLPVPPVTTQLIG